MGDASDSHIKNSTAKAATLETHRIEIAAYLTDLFAKRVERVSLPMMEEIVRKTERTGNLSAENHVCALIRMASRRESFPRGLPYVADELNVKQKPKKKPGILFDAKDQWPAFDLIEGIKSPTSRVAWLLMLLTGLREINARAI